MTEVHLQEKEASIGLREYRRRIWQMSNIVEKIKEIHPLYHVKGCTEEQIQEAQSALKMEFPEEFVDYVREFGVISFYGTEWTGLNVEGYLNVVEATRQEKSLNEAFPKKCFVLENQGIDGVIIVVDETGRVFVVQFDQKKLLCDSLSEYLDLCIARKSK